MFTLLTKSELSGGVEIRNDLLSSVPTALSRKRAQRLGKPEQKPNEDNGGGPDKCLLCNPEMLMGQPTLSFKMDNDVAAFDNAAPFLPRDQKVLFMWHEDANMRKRSLHVYQLKDVRREELYFLLSAGIEFGKAFPPEATTTFDILRMIVGFNLGRLAGQTIPHVHMQYGWDVIVGGRTITRNQLNLYYEELEAADLTLYADKNVKVIAPWTPKGQYAIDLHFYDNYEIRNLSEREIKIFAHFGWCILQHYVNLGIQNVNIVFTNSPLDRKIEPVVAHFVPRVNMPALYEILGVNVVDTPPTAIAEEFRRNINWEDEIRNIIDAYNPKAELKTLFNMGSAMADNSRLTRGKASQNALSGHFVSPRNVMR